MAVNVLRVNKNMLFGRLVLLVKVGWSQVKRWEVMESDLF